MKNGPAECAERLIRQPTCGGAMGVSDGDNRFSSLFKAHPLGPRIPPGRAGWAHLGALIDVPSGRFGPIHHRVGPYRSTLWPIRGSALFGALVALPFGRFGA